MNETESYYDFDVVNGSGDSGVLDGLDINYSELIHSLLVENAGIGSDKISSSSNSLADSADIESSVDIDLSSFSSLNESKTLRSASRSVREIGDSEPAVLEYNGAVWITGTDSRYGDLTLYFPPESKYSWGTTRAGYLVNLGNETWHGVSSGNLTGSVSVSSFSRPRNLSVSNEYLFFVPSDSNAPIAVTAAPRVSLAESLPLFVVAALGVIILFLNRSRH